ncbi:translation initiation factor IF-2-like [Manacus candei]|uniref:translation initiation factor IF-2-like n=1 Tax=Manacus candei TaxID=415023 RepID=UPI002227792A|nr:translation initiation factor IF-2-like [Manacus candei]
MPRGWFPSSRPRRAGQARPGLPSSPPPPTGRPFAGAAGPASQHDGCGRAAGVRGAPWGAGADKGRRERAGGGRLRGRAPGRGSSERRCGHCRRGRRVGVHGSGTSTQTPFRPPPGSGVVIIVVITVVITARSRPCPRGDGGRAPRKGREKKNVLSRA